MLEYIKNAETVGPSDEPDPGHDGDPGPVQRPAEAETGRPEQRPSVDVRLVLALAALPLFALAGMLPDAFALVAKEMANPGTVVPICSAMGFAYVLRCTQCDVHLVHLLLRPLHSARGLLIPGGIAAGYLVNTAIVSQSGAAAVLGPILIPLLRAGG